MATWRSITIDGMKKREKKKKGWWVVWVEGWDGVGEGFSFSLLMKKEENLDDLTLESLPGLGV